MAKADLNPLFDWFSGSIGRLVFRRSHSGKQIVGKKPDMTRVKWSPAQIAQRRKMAAASAYATAALKDPELHRYYLRMARRKKKNNRPYDMAVSDYFKGNNRLPKKLPGD